MRTYLRNTDFNVVLRNMVEVKFPNGNEDCFRITKETLERMGIAYNRNNLCQTAHILHKRGRYYICHFKELFALDGRYAELTDEDLSRRNLIVSYLKKWGMIETITANWEDNIAHVSKLKIVKYHDRDNWLLTNKYTVGVLKK